MFIILTTIVISSPFSSPFQQVLESNGDVVSVSLSDSLPSKVEREEKVFSSEFGAVDVPLICVYSAVFYFLTLVVHEIGHLIGAGMAGIGIDKMNFLPSKYEGEKFILAYTLVNTKQYRSSSSANKLKYAMGGMAATRLVAESLDGLMDQNNISPRLCQALAVAYFLTRFDVTRYLITTAIKYWAKKEISNVDDPVRIARIVSERNEQWFYLVGFIGAILDVVLDIPEISRNLKRLFLMPVGDQWVNNIGQIGISITDSSLHGYVEINF